MKPIVPIALSALLFNTALMASPGFDFDQSSPRKLDIQSMTTDISVPEVKMAVQKAEKKEWTVMVFMNGRNSLTDDALDDLNEMEAIGSTDRVNVVVQMGRMNGESQQQPYFPNDLPFYNNGGIGGFHPGGWTPPPPPMMMRGATEQAAAPAPDPGAIGVRRLFIMKDSNPKKVTSPIVQALSGTATDMGDWKNLVDFGKWAKANYPAKKYLLIVWNHGAGWKDKSRSRGISYDDITDHHITTPQLGQAVKEIGGTDIYASDACLMQMASVNAEMKDYVQYIVGSEETEAAAGYDYTRVLTNINANVADTKKVAEGIVTAYRDCYTNGKATQSAVDSKEMDNLARLTKAWVEAVMAVKPAQAAKDARLAVMKYSDTDYVDMYHFVSLLSEKSQSADIKAKGDALLSQIKGKLVVANYMGKYANTNGISEYVPGYKYNTEYDKLAWTQASKWGELANWITTIK